MASLSTNPLDEYFYDGEWYQGFKQGRGRLITKREKYSGTWLRDKYHTNGVLVYTDSTKSFVYEGDWSFGTMEGLGQYTDSLTGDVYKGEFKKDKFSGKVISPTYVVLGPPKVWQWRPL